MDDHSQPPITAQRNSPAFLHKGGKYYRVGEDWIRLEEHPHFKPDGSRALRGLHAEGRRTNLLPV